MNISLDGSNLWQTGRTVAEYAITPDGATALTNYRNKWKANNTSHQAFSQGVDSQLAQQYNNILMQTFNQRKKAAMDAYEVFATASAPPLPDGTTFPAS